MKIERTDCQPEKENRSAGKSTNENSKWRRGELPVALGHYGSGRVPRLPHNKRSITNNTNDEILWRKDGSSFPVGKLIKDLLAFSRLAR